MKSPNPEKNHFYEGSLQREVTRNQEWTERMQNEPRERDKHQEVSYSKTEVFLMILWTSFVLAAVLRLGHLYLYGDEYTDRELLESVLRSLLCVHIILANLVLLLVSWLSKRHI